MARRTLREWFAYLDAADRPFTLEEFVAVMIMNQREYARIALEDVGQLRQAAEHSESMLGALDELAERLARMQGLPYAGSATVRAALDADRDRARLAARNGTAEG